MANDCWETPQYIFDWLDEEFDFDIDLAADESNTKCNHYLDKFWDSLKVDWSTSYLDCLSKDRNRPVCWLNPPYSDPLPWVKKAYEESQYGATIVCLLPADTSTKWFHDWVYGKAEIRFIRGRVRFVDPTTGKVTKDPPKSGSMIVIYGPDAKVGQVFTVDRPDIKVKHIS
jgi:site-specific DNA-methyltransferase (adenine-specific)